MKGFQFESHSGSYETCFKECAVMMYILVAEDHEPDGPGHGPEDTGRISGGRQLKNYIKKVK